MRRFISTQGLIGLIVCAGDPAPAATVRFDIAPTSNPAAAIVKVARGSEVAYDVYVQVISDDATTPDNNGLAFFTLDVVTDLTVAQPPLDSFDPLIGQYFTIVPSSGTPSSDDVLQIGGGQNTFIAGKTLIGIAAGADRQLLGQGRLITPTGDGTYTVTIADTAKANVFALDSSTKAIPATIAAGSGFQIQIGDTKAEKTAKTTSVGVAAVGLGALIVLAALFAFGPLAGLIAIVLVPLILLLVTLNNF